MRADLTDAIKGKRGGEVALLRALLAAVDNAQAPPMAELPARGGPGEVARLPLDAADIRALLAREISEREQAADQFAALGHSDRADTLREQAAISRRYLTPATSD